MIDKYIIFHLNETKEQKLALNIKDLFELLETKNVSISRFIHGTKTEGIFFIRNEYIPIENPFKVKSGILAVVQFANKKIAIKFHSIDTMVISEVFNKSYIKKDNILIEILDINSFMLDIT